MRTLATIVLFLWTLNGIAEVHSVLEKEENSARTVNESDPGSYEFLCSGTGGLFLVRDGTKKEIYVTQNGDWVLKEDQNMKIEEARVLEELTSLWGTTDPKYIESMPEKSRANLKKFLERQKQSGEDLEVFIISNPATCPHCVNYEPTANRLLERWKNRVLFRIAPNAPDNSINDGLNSFCGGRIPCTLFRKRSSNRVISGLLGEQSEQSVEKVINQNLSKEPPKEAKPLVRKNLKPCEAMAAEKGPEKIQKKDVKGIKRQADGSYLIEKVKGGAYTVTGDLPSDLSLDDATEGNHFAGLSVDTTTKKGKLTWTECTGDSCLPKSKEVSVGSN